jgi:phosphomannomutase
MTGIFRAYDIRGVFPDELTEQVANRTGKAIVNYIKELTKEEKLTLVIGIDMRASSPLLKQQVVEGMVDQGADVIDIGMVSTPAFYYAVASGGYDGGIMVTASHNPKEYNGLKLVTAGAKPIGEGNGMEEVEKLVLNNLFESKEVGIIKKVENIPEAHVDYERHFSSVAKIKPLKIVVDTANGMGYQFLKILFQSMNCEVTYLFDEPDGNFPNHEADPLKEENNKAIQEKIREIGADLGIAADGDGDRVFFMDETGKTIPQQIIRGLLGQIFLRTNPGATICYDIRPGKITPEMITNAGGKAVMTRVGHSLIKATMLEEDAVFGGENSGHMFVKFPFGTYEAPVVIILKLLDEWSHMNKKVSEIIKPYEKYFHSGEINSEVEDKQGKMKAIADIYKDTAKDINWLDGVSIDCEDYWFNIRPSNTEPKLRFTLEAVSLEIMEKKRDEILKIIRS